MARAEHPGSVHIGTSGWHYQQWKGPFYAKGQPDDQLLAYYAKHFHTAEINNTFYQLPRELTVREWRDTVPEGFIFAVKGSRYISHQKKLKDPEQSLPKFLDRIELLREKRGPVLFQLPPKWGPNPDRLKAFLRVVPDEWRCAFEFRNPSWFEGQIEEVLSDSGAAFCIYDIDGRQSPRSVTADFVYIRLHGPDRPYSGRYQIRQLEGWADFVRRCTEEGRDVYCYFDNDENGYAALNASELQDLVKGH